MRQDPPAVSRQPPSPNDAAEQVRRVSERLALLHFGFARTIIDVLGPEDGRRLTIRFSRPAVWEGTLTVPSGSSAKRVGR